MSRAILWSLAIIAMMLSGAQADELSNFVSGICLNGRLTRPVIREKLDANASTLLAVVHPSMRPSPAATRLAQMHIGELDRRLPDRFHSVPECRTKLTQFISGINQATVAPSPQCRTASEPARPPAILPTPPRPLPTPSVPSVLPLPVSPPDKLVPARIYLRAADIPPRSAAAYGVVALRSKGTPASRQRLLRVCASFLSSLPKQNTLPAYVPLSDQMLTIWPLDEPDADQAKRDDCSCALDHYDLYGGISAIQDAERQKVELDGPGPFLIGWSPSNTRGIPDKLVLVIDLSSFESQASFDEAFLLWQKKIVQNPELWRGGFSLEQVRLALRDFVDHYGQDVIKMFRLSWR